VHIHTTQNEKKQEDLAWLGHFSFGEKSKKREMADSLGMDNHLMFSGAHGGRGGHRFSFKDGRTNNILSCKRKDDNTTECTVACGRPMNVCDLMYRQGILCMCKKLKDADIEMRKAFEDIKISGKGIPGTSHFYSIMKILPAYSAFLFPVEEFQRAVMPKDFTCAPDYAYTLEKLKDLVDMDLPAFHNSTEDYALGSHGADTYVGGTNRTASEQKYTDATLAAAGAVEEYHTNVKKALFHFRNGKFNKKLTEGDIDTSGFSQDELSNLKKILGALDRFVVEYKCEAFSSATCSLIPRFPMDNVPVQFKIIYETTLSVLRALNSNGLKVDVD
jgi:hypothetical protein